MFKHSNFIVHDIIKLNLRTALLYKFQADFILLSSVFRNPKSNKYYFYYITNLYLTQCKKPVRLIMKIAKFNSTIHLYSGILFCTSGV